MTAATIIREAQKTRDLSSTELSKCCYWWLPSASPLQGFSRREWNADIYVYQTPENPGQMVKIIFLNLCTRIREREKHNSYSFGQEQCLSLRQRFSVIALLGFGTRWAFVAGGCSVPWGMLSSLSGFYSLDASGIPTPPPLWQPKNISRHCQKSLGGAKLPPVKRYWLKDILPTKLSTS